VTAICAIVAYLLGFSFWLGMCRGRRDPWPDAILLAAIWPLAFAWHRAKFGTFAAFLLLVLAATSARATPYFRPLDLASARTGRRSPSASRSTAAASSSAPVLP
jgi:hypothetical protein